MDYPSFTQMEKELMDQKKLVELYNTLKPLLKVYEKKWMAPKIDLDSRYDLLSKKKWVIMNGKIRDEVRFAALIIQSTYVGFYFMPIYTDPHKSPLFGKELLATLKWKSCFHIKKLDDTLIKQIKDALENGYKIYKENWRV